MFDFVTHLWLGAQRAPANMPPDLVPATPDDFPQSLPTPSPDRVRQVSAKPRKALPLPAGDAALVRALMVARGALTITELAAAMSCRVSEFSKRVKAAGKRVKCKREGRCKMVQLRKMTLTEWTRLASEADA